MGLQIGESGDIFARYGVYFTMAQGPATEFGARWLGWDLSSGRAVAHPEIKGLPRPISAITQTPRKYGFHATIKPPFRLDRHSTFEGLAEAIEALTKEAAPVVLDGLTVSTLGHFVALTPLGDTTALGQLARQFVCGLDMFRATATQDELARRRKAGLSAGQEDMLQKWGYPYVLDEFRFHMTLSGKLPKSEADAVRRVLGPEFAKLLPGQVKIDGMTLVGEAEDGQFHLIRRYPLKGTSARL